MDPTIPLLVEELSKSYRGRVVLRDVSLRVLRGQATAVIGPNGAGKSTLLGCITGDRLPDRGRIRVCGADPFSDLAATARCMGFVPEQPFLYGELAVGELLGLVVEARRLQRAVAEPEVERLLELLGLSAARGVPCRELSQGMGRKVALIAGMLHRPPLLVLDEAFNGLDRASSDRLVDELDRRRLEGAAVLLSSHDLDFLARWCDRGLLLDGNGGAHLLDGESWTRWREQPRLSPP